MINNYIEVSLGKAKNLAGYKFGRLIPKYRTTNIGKKTAWVCECECGQIVVVTADKLTQGSTQSCGCLQKERTSKANAKDLTGLTFNRLTVIQKAKKNSKNSDRHIIWLCKCECGNEVIVSSNNLISGHTQSCGCLQKECSAQYHSKDLTNRQSGLLTPLKIAYQDSAGNYYWHCQCKCGNTTIVRASHLLSGETRTCGCLKKSYGEIRIAQLLDENNYTFTKEQIFDDCKNPYTGYHLKFDFYVDNKYCIEFDGIQHFKERNNGYFESLSDIQYRDSLKNLWCSKHNIPLIRIPYYHLNNLTIDDLRLETSKFLYLGDSQ